MHMASSVTVKPLSWGEIDGLKTGQGLWVMNNSDLGRKQQRGEVHLPIRDGDIEVSIPIPNTWIPINLVEFVTLDSLKASAQLRTLLRSQVIVAVSEETAKQHLDSSRGQEEAARVRGVMAESASNNIGIGASSISIDTSRSGKAIDPTPIPKSGEVESSTIAVGLAEDYENGADEQDLIDRLNEAFERGKIKGNDIYTAMDNLANKGSALYLRMADIVSGESMPADSESRHVKAM